MITGIVFLPLIGALIVGFFGRALGDKVSQIITTGLLMVAAAMSWFTFFDVGFGGNAYTVTVLSWVASGDFIFNWALKVDTLTAVMLIVVTTVSSVVHLYSIGYMHHDKSVPRFMAYLSFFTFAMLMLVTADNLVQMFFGWEGVGVASYLLIGFWFEKPSANAAAMKAFIVNRVGDFGFALGIFLIFVLTGSVEFDTIFAAIPAVADANFVFLGMEFNAITISCLLLFMGAMGKSAQLGLHTWLPDAMEGPTPVSALIHAATMVTAGVFMVCRLSPIFEFSEVALTVVTIVGATTAFFAATVGLTQTDIKRVIAYSTCSQLGYMFFAAGVSAYPAAMFHLTTHAFFKALLFLGAGSVIHAMSDEQNMMKMGGIRKLIPFTWAVMLIGTLAITGVPGLSGYFSKDMIIEAAYAAGSGAGGYAFWLGVIAALMTSFYSWRLMFLTFHGKPRADEKTMAHVHESPLVMTIPLAILAVGAVGFGAVFAGDFIGEGYKEFWGSSIYIAEANNIMKEAKQVPSWVVWSPFIVMVLGLVLAWVIYIKKPGSADKLAKSFSGLYAFSLNKWYFDELYDAIFVKPSFVIGRFFWKRGDEKTIDYFGPDGVAARTKDGSKLASLLQSGYVYHYAFAMLIGVVVFVTWYMLSGMSA
ncbi:NADH-quinone oxidoreductase subunit L [Curvivirga aplysinae]|uniref:NADH-quinone oxidoreductase subunit L n=1 Tax=Curvivirga aplysinae TaxID=2529852 RepID=UPI0012BCC018|nr:NADH-quinone oxidoreductase subunit L [Curvivirga aplysinae]MTI09354.1 NADH-quinone oxidoreductase subunit L [Curvivirga aplysinae]